MSLTRNCRANFA